MIPIYEQGSGRGIGHSLESFIARFEEILKQHRETNQVVSFAFIFYDFQDYAIKRILQDQGAFAKLDRLSGPTFSIFYLHTGGERAVRRFNSEFSSRIGISDPVNPPCVVFFKYHDEIDFVSVVQLESADLIHGLNELYTIIEAYKSGLTPEPRPSKALRWMKGAAKFVSEEAVKAAIRQGLGHLPF